MRHILKDIVISAAFMVALSVPPVGLTMSLTLPEEHDEPSKHFKIIPYAFTNESTGPAVAAAGVASGYIQPQMKFVGNAFTSTNGSTNLFLTGLDYQIPRVDRLFFNAMVMYADWEEIDSYQEGNPIYINEMAGSHDSDEDNYVEVDGEDLHYRLKFRYLLPIGHGKDTPIHIFKVRDGLLLPGYEAGGGKFNPFVSGRTTANVEWFYREQDVEDNLQREFDNITSGLKFEVEYDNTDWYANPSYGSRTRLSMARDWGAESDAVTWTAWQFQFSKFFELSHGDNVRQRVLALDFWYSDVPTWNSSHTVNGNEVFHRAPLFEGSSLGGLERQRGYPADRFHDRSAINYAIEYREMPRNNIFTDIPLINKLHIPWWQWVAFLEAGRVSSSPDLGSLHESMKVSAGAGIRALVEGLVIRVDVAGSEEGGRVQMFFNHTF